MVTIGRRARRGGHWLGQSSGLVWLAGVMLVCGLANACADDVYVIGATCVDPNSCGGSGGNARSGGEAGGGEAGSGGVVAELPGLGIEFDGSGVERLPTSFLGVTATQLLIAADADEERWTARLGDDLDVTSPSNLKLGQPSPFADSGGVLIHSQAPTFAGDASWADTRTGAVAFEMVFRSDPGATLLSQHDESGGVEVQVDADGRLIVTSVSGSDELQVASLPLVVDAWHHCMWLFETGASAQVFCNGHPGAPASVPSTFEVASVEAPVILGTSNPARVHWAELARFESTTWGERARWSDAIRERFARMVGTYAEGSPEPLPLADVRASGAYLDMTSAEDPTTRSLHPVGEHWPRLVCRPTNASDRTCGLLFEAASSAPVPASAFTLDQWISVEIDPSTPSAPGPAGDLTLYPLTPTATNAEHFLEFDAPFADGPAVLSLFARAAGESQIRIDAVGIASATFEFDTGAVVGSSGTESATVEDWGEGLFRVSLVFQVDAGPGTLRLQLLDGGGNSSFAGDGTVGAIIGDVELRFRSYSAPLPSFGPIQQADRLVYPATGGNLPAGRGLRFEADFWMPDAPLVADAALLNANFDGQYDPQVNLFVSAESSGVQFWGIQGGATWQVASGVEVTGGEVHRISAVAVSDDANLVVDDQSVRGAAGPYDYGSLDRIEVGNSTASSGPLSGILSQIRIEPVE